MRVYHMLRSSPDRAAEVDELLREPGVGFAPIARGRPAISYRTNQPASCVGVRHIGPFRASLRIMGRYVQIGRSKPIQIGCFRALMRRELCISGFSVHQCKMRADMHRSITKRGPKRPSRGGTAPIRSNLRRNGGRNAQIRCELKQDPNLPMRMTTYSPVPTRPPSGWP